MIAALLLALAPLPRAAGEQDPAPLAAARDAELPGPRESAAQARPALERALSWLLAAQRSDGSWASPVMETVGELGFSVESFYAWQVAAGALAVDALREARPTPEREAALVRGARWLASTPLPKRGSEWDIDYQWNALLGLAALTGCARDARLAEPELRQAIAARGAQWWQQLARTQTPEGGWGYYDDPVFSVRPKWATSFSTAAVIPALAQALELGFGDDRRVLERAVDYVRGCQLPSGAYTYDWTPLPRVRIDSINALKGSLGRIQVCNWALRAAGQKSISDARIEEGLAQFFEHRKFLEIARLRQIPHEAYYQNASYFYLFGHYYAARAIALLPQARRERWFAQLRPHLTKIQESDGSARDMLGSSYERVAGTAYFALALGLADTGEPAAADAAAAPEAAATGAAR